MATASTKPSKLQGGTPAMSKSESLPMLKIRTQPENILIPSVKLERSNSRRSERTVDDSRSFDSFGSLALSVSFVGGLRPN
jgi:hypothetical protein